MKKPDVLANEPARVSALRGLGILDTPPEERFDRITRIAQRVFNVPIALVSLVDSDRQWFKSCQGLPVSETPRDISFCGHAILGSGIFVIPDALNDERFADNPLVSGEPKIRFYAGCSLTGQDGLKLGTLCIIDRSPRTFTDTELQTLSDLAHLVERELNERDLVDVTAALLESEKRLSLALNSSGLALWDWNIASGQVYLSEQWSAMLGGEQVPSNTTIDALTQLTHPHERARVQQAIVLAVRGSAPFYQVEHRVRDLNDEWRWIHSHGKVAERSADGRAVRMTGINSDITERKHAEDELRESAQRIKTIVDTVVDGLITISDQGLVESFNPAAERIFGFAATEVVGQNIKMLMPEPYHSQHDGYLENYCSSGVRRIIGTGREVVGRRKDGSTFPLELAVSEMWLGERRLFTGLVRDVTARKRAEEDLRRFKNTLDNTLDMIFMFDPESLRFVYLNRGAVESMGYSREELLEMTPYQIKPQMTESVFREYISPLLSGNKHALNFETMHRRKNGTDFPVEIFLQLVREPGERGLFVAMVRDITARKKVERMKNEFVSTVSHELRTPLTSIRGSLGLIAGGVAGVVPPQAQELLGIAYKNSERLTRLINDILDIEKIESGKMKFDMKPIELMPLVEQALEANRGYATELGVNIRIQQAVPVARVFADPERIMQVMANLLSNAAKFTPHGSLVEINVGRESGKLRVSVRDHGPGIPHDFQSRVFEKFSQADSSDTRTRGGSGLGLSISKTIVEKHGGYIGFETEPGSGTVFFFELPEWQPGAAGSAPKLHDRNMVALRLLVCEDDPDIARLLTMMLEQSGFDVDAVHDAEQAKRHLRERHYAAMTLDLALPGQDGVSFIRELRTDPATRSLPVVVVSAHAADGRTQLNGGFAVVDWLGKPIEPHHLIASIERAVHSPGGHRPHVLHIENDADVRCIVAMAGQDQAEFDGASTLAEARVKLALTRYHLVILDLTLPDGSGWDLLPVLRTCDPPPPVLVFSAKDTSADEARQVAATLVKAHTSNEELMKTVRALIQQGMAAALPAAPAASSEESAAGPVTDASQICEKRHK